MDADEMWRNERSGSSLRFYPAQYAWGGFQAKVDGNASAHELRKAGQEIKWVADGL